MSRNYTGLGHYEQLFDQLDAAISRLETRCDKIERRRTNLLASKATYAQQACYDSRREIRTRPRPEPPPQQAQDLPYYSLPPWDPPGHRQQFGRAAYEPLPARRTCRETQGQRTFRGYSAYEQPLPNCWDPPRRWQPQQESATPYGAPTYGQPTCWDPPKQQEYSSHEPPTHVDPLDRGFVKFRPLPQPPLPHRLWSEIDEGRCYGEVVTHTHSPTLDGDERLCDLEDSILEEEHCDSENSILETVARKLMDRGLPSENRGSREGRDGRLEDQQVSSFAEIYPPRSPDMSKEKEEEALLDDVEEDDSTDEVKKVIASLNVVQVSSKNVVGNCWGKKGDGAYTDLPVIACVYVDLNVGDVPRMNHRSTSLDKDARLIPPSNDMPCLGILGGVDKLFDLARNFSDKVGSPLLIFYGGEEGRRSSVRCVFDPGGVASPKLLLSTLLFASWFPP